MLFSRSILASKTITPTYLEPINTAEDLLSSQLNAFCTDAGLQPLLQRSTFKKMKNRIDPGLLDSLQENIERLIASRKLSTIHYQEQNMRKTFVLIQDKARRNCNHS